MQQTGSKFVLSVCGYAGLQTHTNMHVHVHVIARTHDKRQYAHAYWDMHTPTGIEPPPPAGTHFHFCQRNSTSASASPLLLAQFHFCQRNGMPCTHLVFASDLIHGLDSTSHNERA
eukprot:scpid76088/ scgid14088/ 